MKATVRVVDNGAGQLVDRLVRTAHKRLDITVGVHAADGAEPKKGTEGEGEDGTPLIAVAAAHEFGLGVPRRSFIADWADENLALHKKQVAAMARAVVAGTVDANQAAARLANLWVAEVQKRIVAGIAPPLSEKTIRRKKSSTPLIDTGQLRSAITYAINGEVSRTKAASASARASAKKSSASRSRRDGAEKAKAEKRAAKKAAPKKARARPPKKPPKE